MAPCRVDPNKKQAKSSIYQVEEDLFWIVEWQELFQLQVKLQFIRLRGYPKNYTMNVLMSEKHGDFQL
jgi:hypothetical protein